MTDTDRTLIVQNCLQSEENRIVITHGTDTMTDTAAALARAVPGKNRGAYRSDDPLRLWQLRRSLQSWQRAFVRAGAASRSLHCHTRSMLSVGPRPEKPRARRVRRNFVERAVGWNSGDQQMRTMCSERRNICVRARAARAQSPRCTASAEKLEARS
jgi:hypothetical protein